jgi:SAM-dependent methyltransferase
MWSRNWTNSSKAFDAATSSARAMTGKDLFGRAFMDYHRGRGHKLYIERDDGFVDEQDVSQYFRGFDDFPECERRALAHAKGRVLDIGVGAGRVALYLQSRGSDVVGIDISDNMLEICRERGVKNLRKMSACDLKFKKDSFDTAVAFCNNFGLCGNMFSVMKMLERLHDIVKRDGLFLASSIDPLNTSKKAHLKYHEINRSRGRPPGQVTLRDKYRGQKDQWWDLLMVTSSELKELCDRTGWKLLKTYPGVMNVYVLKRV